MAKKSKDVPVTKETGSPTPQRSHDLFASLHHEADRLFGEFSRAWTGSGLPSVFGKDRPAVDMVENKTGVEVRAELPGIDEGDIEVELTDDRLTIRAEKRDEREEGGKDDHYHVSERRYGSFERTLTLPESADVKKPEASFANGVLTVAFPKTREAMKEPRKIKVKGA